MSYYTNLQGKFAHKVGEPVPEFNTEFPVHPGIVHFPIAFNVLAWGLDILYALTAVYVKPDFLTTRFGSPSTLLDITRLSYFLLCAGLITTVPAIMSGNIQLVGMIKKNGGPWEKDAAGKQKSTMVPRIKACITHAIMNDLVFVVNLYSWYLRKDKEGAVNLGKIPTQTNLIISMVLLPALMASSKIGGTLVFNHGVGLNLGRKKFE
ncbi:uncharacterized protein PV07_04106 [Cladophialophora immunda]|uniref:DUF2231 domain-containing protein n=1 Tax=Cladophialophora immunda TaxID=569365 RepID=A0A0D1ZWQ6_9EURO|nr:uncharacterized protein PV07_04106 [Cladophialophora immunda]KIW32576.1 hypothetical protein PV07_04106 [Cladophialophora immunda]OQU98925.1 hypothetical protein CLAIMM_04634 [Cladophialophora immunda]